LTPEEIRELRHYARTIMGEREYRIASCAGKSAFRSFELAASTIRPERRREMGPYHCGACGLFHVGSRATGDKRRKAMKRLREAA
jgi:hypothetical protein